MQQYQHIQTLFTRYMEGTITEAEREELSEAAEVYSQKEWEEVVLPLLEATPANEQFKVEEWEERIRFILQQPPVKKTRVVNMVYRWTAAAAIVVMVVVGSYFAFFNKKADQQVPQVTVARTDVEAPKSTRAMITLADGRTVALDSLENGTLAVQNNIRVIKTADGAISYQLPSGVSPLPSDVSPLPSGVSPLPSDVSRLTYNTLTNPRGSKVIDITLSDGTRVWLNAGSSLKYPVAFTGNERKVEITGEAYFEVAKLTAGSYQLKAKNQQRKANSIPFLVSKGNMQVTVLGTHFNVNAYDDEEAIKVTLLEGSVRVAANSEKRTANSVVLIPGQQAVLTKSEQRTANSEKRNANSYQLTANSSVDLDEVMAWKNGLFQFGDKADIRTIMRQLARWYDVDVEYKGAVSGHFGGSISREVNISQVLRIMEATGSVRFRVEGRKLTVYQP